MNRVIYSLDVDPIATTFPSADHLKLKSHEKLIQSLGNELDKEQCIYDQLNKELAEKKEKIEKKIKELSDMEDIMLL